MIDGLWQEVKNGFAWLWGLIKGDFNSDPSTSQIITNMIITAIPVVDQVADVRDIIANLKLLVWDKKYNEFAPWLALFFTLIGLIPTVGSLLKGVLKLIWKGARLDEVLKLFNHFMKGNGVRWLRELQAGKLKEYADDAAKLAHDLLNNFIAKVLEIKARIPRWMLTAHSKLDSLLGTLRTVKSKINTMFTRIADEMAQKLDNMLARHQDEGVDASARGNVTRQQEAAPPSLKPPSPEEVQLAKSTGSSPKHIAARTKVAEHYLRESGFSDKQVNDFLGTSFDYRQPIEVVSFPPPETMTQWVASHGHHGNWFDPVGTGTPDTLAIDGAGRTLETFKVPEGTGLKSIAAAVDDATWGAGDIPLPKPGGATQLLIPQTLKPKFIKLTP